MSAPAAGGRIPIRLDPVAGESLDGWLDAYAQRLRISTVALGQALEIPRGLLRARSGVRFALAHDAPDPARVAARACGIHPADVEALWLGLTRYDRLISQCLGASRLAQILRPLRWSRFCPTCLGQNGGRWLAGRVAAAVVPRVPSTSHDARDPLPALRSPSARPRTTQRPRRRAADKVRTPIRRAVRSLRRSLSP